MTNQIRDDVIIQLVDTNKGASESSQCGTGISCYGISCTECPLSARNGHHTIGQVRAMDTRKVAPGAPPSAGTYTGGSVDYYQVTITNPTTEGRPGYIAECNDIIEALGMNFAEGNAFKALWRRAAQRTLGLRKAGAKGDGLYDAEKVKFFGERLVAQSKGLSDESE